MKILLLLLLLLLWRMQRLEGRAYAVQDGDVLNIRFKV